MVNQNESLYGGVNQIYEPELKSLNDVVCRGIKNPPSQIVKAPTYSKLPPMNDAGNYKIVNPNVVLKPQSTNVP